MIALSLIKCNESPVPGEMDNFVIRECCNATTASRYKKRKKTENCFIIGKNLLEDLELYLASKSNESKAREDEPD